MKSKDLSNYRENYSKGELLENDIKQNPMEQFRDWFLDAENSCDGEANAMNIATIGKDGFPKNRMVLLKKIEWDGFVFYTNYDSEKGQSISENNRVCISFFWQKLERQVIIKGLAEKLPEKISNNYFHKRPKGSQIGAWASQQSKEIISKEKLDEKLELYTKKFEGCAEVPKPKNWGGYIVKPHSIEFWQGRPNRMHDRILYVLDNDFNWSITRLQP